MSLNVFGVEMLDNAYREISGSSLENEGSIST
jgi:hypothetical protein